MAKKSFIEFLDESTGLKARFMKGVTKTKSGCWKWSKAVGTDSYGQIWKDGSAKPAHQVAYELFKGKAPSKESNKVIMHLCDNKPGSAGRACCNPAHLKIGSKSENQKDMVNKGRQANQHEKGKNYEKAPRTE